MPFPIEKLKKTWVYRQLQSVRGCGFVLPGLNITFQRDFKNLRSLIRKLQPQDCGKNLIRIGPAGDGGYLVPDDLEGVGYCFSPGVGTKSEFENQLAERGIHSFLADYSVDEPAILRPEFTFDKKFLGSRNNEQLITLASWKKKYIEDYTGDLILQMDIQGAEYEVILNTPDELLNQFRILVIEFHHFQRLFDPFCFELFSSCFEKLLASFHVVHIHPNNGGGLVRIGDIEIPRLIEFTFLNKKRGDAVKPVRTFPNRLDARNAPGRKDFPLPKCWYAGS